ncbi:MAG: oxidoreductase, partial [Gallionella sp.]
MVIKNKTITNDDWTVLRLGEQDTPDGVVVPPGKVIVPLNVWQAQRDALHDRAELGVWLASDERAEDLKDDID